MRAFTLALALVLVSSSAFGQEPVHLEQLEASRIGSASLVAGAGVARAEDGDDDDQAASDLYAVLRGEITSGSQYRDEAERPEGWQPPHLLGSTRLELGAFRKAGTTADLDSRLFFFTPDGRDERVSVAGRHRFAGHLDGGVERLGLHASVDLGLFHSLDGDRGRRSIEVAPAPYRRVTLDPTVWITLVPEGGEGERFGVALDYGLDDRRYLDEGPVRSFRTHRAGLGFGFREDKSSWRGALRFVDVGYAHSQALDAAEQAILEAHRVDVAIFKGRGHFGERPESDRYSRATVGLGLGWSFLGREADRVTHAPNMGLDISYESEEIGRIGGAVGHRVAWAPDGALALGIAYIEAEARMAPNDVPFGGSLAGTVSRLEPLPLRERQERWHASADLELFGRVALAEIGARASLGHGLPSGSMGWSGYDTPLDWFGSLGGFARIESR